MPTYILLGKFTDQGIRNVKDTAKRTEAVRAMAKKAKVTVKDMYWTLGRSVRRGGDPGRPTRRRGRPGPRHRRVGERPHADSAGVHGKPEIGPKFLGRWGSPSPPRPPLSKEGGGEQAPGKGRAHRQGLSPAFSPSPALGEGAGG